MIIFIYIWSSTDSLSIQQLIWITDKTLHLKHLATRLWKMKYALQFQPQPLLTDVHTQFCVQQHTDSSGLGPAKPQTSPRMEIPQPLWEPVPLFYHPHGNSLFLTPHLNSPGCSLCLLPLILLLISGKSWALSTHSKMQLWKKTTGLTYTSNCRNNKYCTEKCIRIREAYDTKSQNTSYYYKTVIL